MYRSHNILCVHCESSTLKLYEESGIPKWKCARCDGLWLDTDAYLALLSAAQPGRDHSPLLHNDGSDRDLCPICKDKMDIAWILFLQFQCCASHGFWLESGVLDRAQKHDVGAEVLGQVNSRCKEREKKGKPRRLAGWAAFFGFLGS